MDSADGDDAQSVVDACEVGCIAGDEWNVQGDGYRRDQDVESARLGVAADGANSGAQRTVDAGGVLVERDRTDCRCDPVVALFAGRIEQWILGVQAMGQLGKSDGAD